MRSRTRELFEFYTADISEIVPAEWFPNWDELLGSGFFGAVWATGDPHVAFKSTRDPSEYTSVVEWYHTNSKPIGMVEYYTAMELPGEDLYFIWREQAVHVGLIWNEQWVDNTLWVKYPNHEYEISLDTASTLLGRVKEGVGWYSKSREEVFEHAVDQLLHSPLKYVVEAMLFARDRDLKLVDTHYANVGIVERPYVSKVGYNGEPSKYIWVITDLGGR